MKFIIESRILTATGLVERRPLTDFLHVDAADDAGAISAFAAAHSGTVMSCERPGRGSESIATVSTGQAMYLLRAYAE